MPTNRLPRWARPAIGVAAAVLLGLAGILVGAQFASPAAATTVDATILAPTAIDGVPVGGVDPSGLGLSEGVGVAGVAPAGSADASELPADIADAAAGLEDAGGTDGTGAPASGPGGGGADDPCAPADGSTPDGCPDGLHSTILADTAPPELRVWPWPDPPATSDGASIYCPDLAPGDGELGVGVGTSVPADVTIRYWPVADPTDVHTLIPAQDASQVAEWDSIVSATGSFPEHSFVFQHCGIMDRLEPHTDYILSAVALDSFARLSSPVERRFNSDGNPDVPPMQVVPLNPSALYASVPVYRGSNPPLMNAWVVGDGEPADCSTFDASHPSLFQMQPPHQVGVTESYLVAHHYDTNYDRAMVEVLDVPEGSTVVICARWYDITRPSWDRDVPTKQMYAVASSPDAVTPVVTLASATFTQDVGALSTTITGSTRTGYLCGSALLPASDTPAGTTLTTDLAVCSLASSPSRSMSPAGGGRGDVVLTSDVAWHGDTVESRYILPLSRYACLGTCALPPELDYTIPLPTVTIGTGMCGSVFGSDCTPPTAETTLGTATVHVSWEQGNTNGLDHWVIGTPDDTPPDAPAPPDAPRFDADRRVDPTLSDDGWTGGAQFLLRSDRHVTYTVSVAGACFVGDAPAPITGETHPAGTGVEADTVTIPRLCPGVEYTLTAELVDADGHRTVATISRDPGVVWWPGARFFVPQRTYAITGTIQVVRDDASLGAWKVEDAAIGIGFDPHYSGGFPAVFPSDRCLAGDQGSLDGTIDADADQARTLQVYVHVRLTNEGTYYGTDHDADCSWPGPNTFVANDVVDVNWDDLRWGGTITHDIPQYGVAPVPGITTGRYHYVLTLRLGDARS
jgi:hypothetical protein